ncbi:unnamed protein product [Paramecium pentaurelia]|uniref:Uncharacterized protein n=1 Tax=Paramecium pentaurelia TaxID=43138 RepID=A0A8S1WGB2_9CILI|nr:unnamed protein product [Paramecium pentaurelia]
MKNFQELQKLLSYKTFTFVKKKMINIYNPIQICVSNNEANEFFNNIIEYFYHPRIDGKLKCKFLNQKQKQIKQNHRIEMLEISHLSMMKIKQKKHFNTKYSQIKLDLREQIKDNDLLFQSKKYIQQINQII